MHCLSEKLISKILFSAKLHSSGIDFPYSTVVGTVTTINLGSAFEMPPPGRRCRAALTAAARRRRCMMTVTLLPLLLHIQLYVLAQYILQKRKIDDTVLLVNDSCENEIFLIRLYKYVQ